MPCAFCHSFRMKVERGAKWESVTNSLFCKKLQEKWNWTKTVLQTHPSLGAPSLHLTTPKLFLFSLLFFLKQWKRNLAGTSQERKECTSGNYQHHIVDQNTKFSQNPTVMSSPALGDEAGGTARIFSTGSDTLLRKWSTSLHFKGLALWSCI